MLENVKPLTNEYSKKLIFAVIGFILVILADKKITRASSSKTITMMPVELITLNIMFGLLAIT